MVLKPACLSFLRLCNTLAQLSGLKQHSLSTHSFMLEAEAWLGALLTMSQGQHPGVGQVEFLSRRGKESALLPINIQIVSKV